ncbi:MAG: poly(3-hydroxyalkanoate) synthetase [Deltaproteobacteria bacterium]|nr:MAG: poly(3-hydroxyalkanoate) synthetase [Deltaproteobacteria bacterium]
MFSNDLYASMDHSLMPEGSLGREACDYLLDTVQRSILFWDVIRQRGTNYIAHINDDQPPVLVFDYDTILDAREFDRPTNYSLVKIKNRRLSQAAGDKQGDADDLQETESPYKRPLVIIDPRAGHGPGIGGSKELSEIGMALNQGHPVYFVMFFTYPMPGQTLADVKNAEIRFLEEVRRRHPKAAKPVVIGNCQGGWASAILSADRPDLVGPLVLNGAPLSYWSGVDGKNPMRYKGGLLGGVWLNSLMSDMSNGMFDGANLVWNMEMLNPANTYWKKEYNLYAKVDTEKDRYLNFERWWGGFFWMTKEEIHRIVDGLFIGNQLVRGTFEMADGSRIDLKNIEGPVVVFASEGDNITPPQQALNWIPQVYDSVDEIRRQKQVVVYIVHPKIGHLGIFVASSIAQKETKEIIGSVEMLEYLSPGLYELIIDEEPNKNGNNDYKVRFEPREMEDILALDDGFDDEEPFGHVQALSELMDRYYNAYLSPFVQSLSSEYTREIFRLLHPLRVQRYGFSDLNPGMVGVKTLAPYVVENRKEAPSTNMFRKMESAVAESVENMWNLYRDLRDMGQEIMFQGIYHNPVVHHLFPDPGTTPEREAEKAKAKAQQAISQKADRAALVAKLESGDYGEALIRMLLAVIGADGSIDEKEMKHAETIIRERRRLQKMKPSELKAIVVEQSRILQTDFDGAIKALPKMMSRKVDRKRAFALAESVSTADGELHENEARVLDQIKAALAL